jgi:hypothetical protein
MSNGDSLEEKKKRLRELWGRAVKKYPSLVDVVYPVDEQTGGLTPVAAAAYAVAKKAGVAPTPTPAPAPVPATAPAMPPYERLTGAAGMGAYVERRDLASQIPAWQVKTPPPPIPSPASLYAYKDLQPQPIPYEKRREAGLPTVEPYRENITYMDDEGEIRQGGWDADIYVDPEGQVRRRADEPFVKRVRPSEAEPWKQDELLGRALTVQSAGGPLGKYRGPEDVRTQRLAHAEPDWLKRKIVDPAAAVVSKAPAVTSVMQNFAKGALAAIAPGVLDRSTKEKLVRGIGEGVRGMIPEKMEIIPGLPDLPLGGTQKRPTPFDYNEPFWQSALTATGPMEAGLLLAGRIHQASSSMLMPLQRAAVTNRPSNVLGTASQILRDLGETSDDANRVVANVRRQHQEFTLLPQKGGKILIAEERHWTPGGQKQLDEVVNLPNSPFKDKESVWQAVADAETETALWIEANLSNSQREVVDGLLRTAEKMIVKSKAPQTIYVKGRITRAYNLNPPGPTKDDIAWLLDKKLQEFALTVEPVEKAVAGGGGVRISVSARAQVAAQEVARGQGKRLITTVGADVPGLEGTARSTGRIEPGVRAAPRAAEAVAPVARVADLPVTTAAPTSEDFLRWSAREAARVAPGEQARRVTRGVAAVGDGPPGPPTAPGLEARLWEPGGWSSSPGAAKWETIGEAHHIAVSPEALMQGARPLGWVPVVGKRIKPIKISWLQRFSGSQDLLRHLIEKAINSGDLSKANKLQKVIGWFARLPNPSAPARQNPAIFEASTLSLFENDQAAWLTMLLARFTGAGRFPVVEEGRRSGLFTNPWLRGKTLRHGSLIDNTGSISLPISKSHPMVVRRTLKPDGTFWSAGDTYSVLFGDMMEAPKRYMLTASQRAWVDDAHMVITKLTDEFTEVLARSKSPVDKAKLARFLEQIADARKLRDKEGLEHYWPRFAEAPDGSVKIVNRTGGQLDSQAGFMHERILPTMQKGVEWGVNYEADPQAVLALWARAVLEQKRNALFIARLTDAKLLVRTKPLKGYSPSKLFGDYDAFFLLNPKNAGKPNPKSVLEGALRAPLQERVAAVPFGESPNQLAWAIAQVFRGAKSATSTTKTTMTGLLDIGVSLLHTTTVLGIGRTRDALQVGFTPGDILTAGGMLGGPQAFIKGVGKGAIVFLGELGPSGTRGIYQRGMTFDDVMRQGQEIGGMNYNPMIEYFTGVSGLSGIGQGRLGKKLVLPALAGRVVGPVLGHFGRASSAAFHQGIGYGRATMFDSYYQLLRVKVRDLILQRNPALRDWVVNPQSRARLEKLLEAEMNTREMRMEALRLGRRTDGMLGVTNVRGLGISRTQQDIEGTMFLFSQTYTRSLLGQLNVLAGSGAMPKETAYILARSLGGAAATIFTIRLSLEMKGGASFDQAWRKASRSLNPRNGREFMAVPVGNGWYGLGGFYRSVAVFIGAASDAEEWDWDEGTLALVKGNPITRVLRGRQPPVAGLVTDILEGEKFTGEPFDITDFFDVTDPEEALEAWFEQVGPFNLEAVIESTDSGATPWGIGAALLLETMGGRYVPIRGSDIKQQAIDNYISAEPVLAMEMEPPLTHLTKPKDLSKTESNEILAYPDNADLVILINELEEKQKGWYGEEGKFWTAVDERRKQMIEDLEQLEKDAEAAKEAEVATLDSSGIGGQPRNYNKVAERYYIANYQSILADYYRDINNLMTEGREEGWLREKGAPKAKRLGMKAQRDYFVLMDGELDEENELLSEAYGRVVRPYLKKEYGVEGKYSPLEMGVQQQIDYNEYHLRLEALRAYYGPKLINATRTAYRAALPKMERERREAADYIREHYHNIKISSQVLDRFFRSEETKRDFVRYIRANQSSKQAMLNAASANSPIQFFPQIEGSSVIRDFKLDARRNDPYLEKVLVTWDVVQKPILEHSIRQGAAWFRMPRR